MLIHNKLLLIGNGFKVGIAPFFRQGDVIVFRVIELEPVLGVDLIHLQPALHRDHPLLILPAVQLLQRFAVEAVVGRSKSTLVPLV